MAVCDWALLRSQTGRPRHVRRPILRTFRPAMMHKGCGSARRAAATRRLEEVIGAAVIVADKRSKGFSVSRDTGRGRGHHQAHTWLLSRTTVLHGAQEDVPRRSAAGRRSSSCWSSKGAMRPDCVSPGLVHLVQPRERQHFWGPAVRDVAHRMSCLRHEFSLMSLCTAILVSCVPFTEVLSSAI